MTTKSRISKLEKLAKREYPEKIIISLVEGEGDNITHKHEGKVYTQKEWLDYLEAEGVTGEVQVISLRTIYEETREW